MFKKYRLGRIYIPAAHVLHKSAVPVLQLYLKQYFAVELHSASIFDEGGASDEDNGCL